MKRLYRRGLGYRYGRHDAGDLRRAFQLLVSRAFWPVLRRRRCRRATPGRTSCPRSYFALLRNYRRYGWLVLYLFGNSPALCASFLHGREHTCRSSTPGTLYEPYATSLRMSDLGYRNKSQSGVQISVNSLEEYVRDLARGGQHAASGVRAASA